MPPTPTASTTPTTSTVPSTSPVFSPVSRTQPANSGSLRGAVLWALLIFVLLSIPTGLVVPSGSGRLLDFLPDLFANAIRLLGDKAVHAVLFAGQVLWLRRAGWPAGRALVCSAAYGAVTELYQALLPFRSGDIYDLLADILGALLAVWWWRWRDR